MKYNRSSVKARYGSMKRCGMFFRLLENEKFRKLFSGIDRSEGERIRTPRFLLYSEPPV
jgi:hypothetical protein